MAWRRPQWRYRLSPDDPGSSAVALVKKVRRQNRSITEADLDAIRNVCRCGTYTRIRKAVRDGASRMP